MPIRRFKKGREQRQAMTKYDFWEDWKKITPLEEKAIRAVIKARDKVVKTLPKDKLVAIYIKGSFTRREMKEGSDVDMVPIVTENEDEPAVFAVNDSDIDPVMVVPLSLWEFEHNKLSTKSTYRPDLRAEPDLFLKKLNAYKLIYGTPIDPAQYPTREDRQIIKDEIMKIRDGYIPAYKKGKTSFSSLLKEVFWLVELVQNIEGKKVSHSFKNISQSVKDKEHIIHAAYQLLANPKHTKAEEAQFIESLNEYLAESSSN